MIRDRERRKTPPSLDSFSVPGGFSVLTGGSDERPPWRSGVSQGWTACQSPEAPRQWTLQTVPPPSAGAPAGEISPSGPSQDSKIWASFSFILTLSSSVASPHWPGSGPWQSGHWSVWSRWSEWPGSPPATAPGLSGETDISWSRWFSSFSPARPSQSCFSVTRPGCEGSPAGSGCRSERLRDS